MMIPGWRVVSVRRGETEEEEEREAASVGGAAAEGGREFDGWRIVVLARKNEAGDKERGLLRRRDSR